MSYDVHLEVDAGGATPVTLTNLSAGHTFNTAKMIVEAAGMGLRDWDGKQGAEVAALADMVIRALSEDAAKYEAMNPANGWGSRTTTIAFMREIYDACMEAPKATFRVRA